MITFQLVRQVNSNVYVKVDDRIIKARHNSITRDFMLNVVKEWVEGVKHFTNPTKLELRDSNYNIVKYWEGNWGSYIDIIDDTSDSYSFNYINIYDDFGTLISQAYGDWSKSSDQDMEIFWDLEEDMSERQWFDDVDGLPIALSRKSSGEYEYSGIKYIYFVSGDYIVKLLNLSVIDYTEDVEAHAFRIYCEAVDNSRDVYSFDHVGILSLDQDGNDRFSDNVGVPLQARGEYNDSKGDLDVIRVRFFALLKYR